MSDAPVTGSPQSPADNPHAESVRTLATAIRRVGVPLGAGAGLAAMAGAALLGGWAGLAGAAVGAVLGFVASLSTVGLMRLTAALPVQALFGAVMGGYIVKIFLLIAVGMPLREVDGLHPLGLGLAMLTVVVAWAAAGIVAFLRTKIPTVIPTR